MSQKPESKSSHMARFESSPMFPHVTACTLADSHKEFFSSRASVQFVTFPNRPKCFRPKRQVGEWDSHPRGSINLSTAHGIIRANPKRIRLANLPTTLFPSRNGTSMIKRRQWSHVKGEVTGTMPRIKTQGAHSQPHGPTTSSTEPSCALEPKQKGTSARSEVPFVFLPQEWIS